MEKALVRAVGAAGGTVEGIRTLLQRPGMREVELFLSIPRESLMKSVCQSLGRIPGVALLGVAALNGMAEKPQPSSGPGLRTRRKPPSPVTQKEIARRLDLHVSTVSKILNRRPGPVYHQRTVRRVFQLARRMGYPLECLKYEHRRRHPRRVVDLPVEFSVYVGEDTLYDRGEAVLRDVSLSGALLYTLVLPGMKLPAGPFIMGIRMLRGPLRKMEILGRPVRFARSGDAVGLAMEFLDTEEAKARQLAAVRA